MKLVSAGHYYQQPKFGMSAQLLSVGAIIDSALFKVIDGLTKRVTAAAGLVPSSVPLLAWETGTGTEVCVQFYLLFLDDDKT